MERETITFSLINDEGKLVKYEVLFTFGSEETGKHYVVYTDNSLDEHGDIRTFASWYNPAAKIDEIAFYPIETEKEWKIIESVLEKQQNGDSSDDK